MLISLSNKTDSNETKIAYLISKVNDFSKIMTDMNENPIMGIGKQDGSQDEIVQEDQGIVQKKLEELQRDIEKIRIEIRK